MNKEKLVKILIPVVALVVILESVILISGLSKGETTTNTVAEVTPVTDQSKEERSPVADYVFATDSKEMKVGKSYKVTLSLVGKEKFMVDAVEVYVKYDPEIGTVSKLVAGKGLPDTAVLKADNTSGLISATFLVPTADKDGFTVAANETKEVFSFMVTPKKEGTLSLSLVTGENGEKLVTVLPETSTSDQLPFTDSKLDINVTK